MNIESTPDQSPERDQVSGASAWREANVGWASRDRNAPDGHDPEGQSPRAVSALWSLEAMKQCAEAGSYEPSTVTLLASKGHIEVMGRKEYESVKALADGLPEAERKVTELEPMLAGLKADVRYLADRVDSTWHYLASFSWLGSGVVDREREELGELAKRRDETNERLEGLVEDRDARARANAHIERYADTGGLYARLTPSGEMLLARMSVRSNILGSVTFDQFERAMADLHEALDARLARFEELRAGAAKLLGRSPNDADVLDHALTLMAGDRSCSELLSRRDELSGWLESYGDKGSVRHKIAAAVAPRKEDVKALIDDLRANFDALTAQGLAKTGKGAWGTMAIAAMLLDVPGGDASDRAARFVRCREQLETSWGKKDWPTMRFAAQIARLEGTPEEAYAKAREMEKALEDAGFKVSKDESAVTARLMGAQGTPEEKVSRLKRTVEAVAKQGFGAWDKETIRAAAALSILPGSPDANAHTFAELRARILADGVPKKNAAPLALGIIGGGLKDLYEEAKEGSESGASEASRSTGQSSGYSSSSTSTDGGGDFFLMWVMMGGADSPLPEATTAPSFNPGSGSVDQALGDAMGGLDGIGFGEGTSDPSGFGSSFDSSSFDSGFSDSGIGGSFDGGSSSFSSCGSSGSSCGSSGSSCGSSCGGGGCGGGGCGS